MAGASMVGADCTSSAGGCATGGAVCSVSMSEAYAATMMLMAVTCGSVRLSRVSDTYQHPSTMLAAKPSSSNSSHPRQHPQHVDASCMPHPQAIIQPKHITHDHNDISNASRTWTCAWTHVRCPHLANDMHPARHRTQHCAAPNQPRHTTQQHPKTDAMRHSVQGHSGASCGKGLNDNGCTSQSTPRHASCPNSS